MLIPQNYSTVMKAIKSIAIKHAILLCCLLMNTMLVFSQQSVSLSGKITDNKSQAIAGATVHLLNSNKLVITDMDGHFNFSNLKQGRYQLEITAIGFATGNRDLLINNGSNENIAVLLADASRKLDEVIVTAQKKEELLQQVPVSISSISYRQIQEFRLWNSKDLTAIVPNLYSSEPGDHRNVTGIRGITTTSYVPAVATYIDGVNQFGLDTYIPVLIDAERIEVLRGPQGTLYGRNAMGGVVNIITRQPTNQMSAFLQADIGNYNQQKYTVGFKTPLVKDKLYIGVAAVYNQRNGYYHNEYNNRPYDSQHSITGNYYLKYIAGKNWVFNLNVKHHDNRNNGAFPLVAGDDAAKKQFVLNQNALTTMVDNTQNASLSANYNGTSINFSSQTAFQKNYRYYKAALDGDFSPLDAVAVVNDYGKKWNNVKVFTQEFKLSSPASSESLFKWTAGSYIFYQDNPSRQGVRYGKDATLIGVPDSLFTVVNTTAAKNFGVAVFGQATYTIAKKTDIIFGLRYDYEHQKQNVSATYQHDPDPTYITTFPDSAAKATFHAFSPKLSVNYHLSVNSMVYATYSRGFRAGGLTPLSSDPSQPPLYSYEPENSNNYELGIKNDLFEKSTRLNLYAFYSNITNAQVPTLVLPEAVTITKNTGKLVSKGVEAELFTQPVRGLELGYNFGYTQAMYKSLKISQNGTSVDLAGKHQIFTPEITSMLSAQYTYLLGGRQQLKAVIRGEWKYLGTTYYNLANTITQAPYNLLNLRAGIAAKNFEVMLWDRNATDTRYFAYAYDFGAVRLGDPKTYGLTLMVRL